MSRTVEITLIVLIALLAVYLRFDGLQDQGLRFVDEGSYYNFGYELNQGKEKVIRNKPLHALLISQVQSIGRASTTSTQHFTAGLGLLILAFFYMGFRKLYSVSSALVVLAVMASMAYVIHYSRSLLTVNLYFLLTSVAVYLFYQANRPESDCRKPLLITFLAATLGGLAIKADPASAALLLAPIAGFLFASFKHKVNVKDKALMALVYCAGMGLVVFTFNQIFSTLIYEDGHLSITIDTILKSGANPLIFTLIYEEGSVFFLLLSAIGLWRLFKEKSFFATMILSTSCLLFAFYLSRAVTFPRVHFPLMFLFFVYAATACDYLLQFMKSKGQKIGLSVALLLLLVLPQLKASFKMTGLKTGLHESVEALRRDGAQKILCAANWSTYHSLAGVEALYYESFPAYFNEERNIEFIAGQLANNFYKGYSHLVVDHAWWFALTPKGRAHLSSFLTRFPAAHRIQDPHISHTLSMREESLENSLDQDFMFERFIYRLDDFVQDKKQLAGFKSAMLAMVAKPKNIKARLHVAITYLRQELYDLAQKEFETILEQDPKHYASFIYLSQIASVNKNLSQALDHLSDAQLLNDSKKEYHGFLSIRYHFLDGKVDDAKRFFDTFKTQYPNSKHLKALKDLLN